MVHPERPAFSALLRRFRLAAGISQEELAERSSMSLGAISALERGVRRRPYRHTVAQLAAALDLSPQERAQFEAASARPPRKQAAKPFTYISGVQPVPHAQAWASAQPALVGRTREWAWLQREFAAERPLVLLSGEPGIGKSRLLREAMDWAHEQGWRALWGGCRRSSGQEPYAPLVEAVERHIRALSPEPLRISLEGCGWLARLLPELADAGGGFVAPPALPSAQEQRLMFAAVERYLSNISSRAGTLLALDDLQWAGADALYLLTHLIRNARMGRLRILGAFRSTEAPAGSALSTFMADLASDELASQIELTPLGPQDALALASDALGGGEPALAARVAQRAGGLPFYLVSYARWMQTLGELNDHREADRWTPGEDDARVRSDARTGDPPRADPQGRGEAPEALWGVPWSVKQSIRERVAALPASTQELLGVAAVVGQRVSGAVLAAGADQSEMEALTSVETACRAGLLQEDPEKDRQEGYRFTHELIRDVIESSLSAGRQTLLHRRVAEALEQPLRRSGAAGHVNDRLLAQVAYHYARAEAHEQAARYLRRAGDHARHVYAHQEAARYYQELVTSLDQLGMSREAAQARKDLAVELARAGRFSEAVEPLDQAEQMCRSLGDVEALALITTVSGQLHAALGTSEEGLARVQPLVAALADMATKTDSVAASAAPASAMAQLQGALSGLSFMAGHYFDALQAAERAVELAQSTGDVGLLARQRLNLGIALFTVGRLAEATEQLKDAGAGAEAVGDLDTRAEALRMASWVYQTRGAFAESQAAQARGLALAQQLGDVVGLGHNLFFDALLAFYLGDWNRARTIAENALAVFRSLGNTHLSAYPPLGLGWLSTVQGDRGAGEQYLAEAEEIARQSGPAQVLRFITALRAECELLAGQAEAANERLQPWFSGEPMQERTRLELSVLRAWAAVELGAAADAQTLLADTVKCARAAGMLLVLPDALRAQALWEIHQRRWRQAEDTLEEAITLCRAMQYPYAEAKALYVFGQMWAAKGEPGRARTRFEPALAICHHLGERLYGQAIEQALAATHAEAQAAGKKRRQSRNAGEGA
jgi:tetratricopeptide (TPR) repeat protein/transcriptional regulator with XRE-family HTH domain